MAATVASAVETGVYEFDYANTRIGFAARYAMIATVRGAFTRFRGEAHLDREDPGRSWVTVSVSTASLDTGQAQRDDHLRGPDFLDVATYPELLFRSTAVTPTGPDRYRVSGELTICGATRLVPLDFTVTGTSTDAAGHELVGFEGSGQLSRADFGLTWNAALETGGVLVGDEVTLQLDVSLMRAGGSPAAKQTTANQPRTGRRRLFGLR